MNTWKRLKTLLEPPAKLSGTVTAHNADGTSTIILTGGGSIRVAGQDYAVNARVFTRDHETIATAPDLPSFIIDI